MSGRWITHVPREHRCPTPGIVDAGVDAGSVWQCECGRVWQLESYIDEWGPLVWRRHDQ